MYVFRIYVCGNQVATVQLCRLLAADDKFIFNFQSNSSSYHAEGISVIYHPGLIFFIHKHTFILGLLLQILCLHGYRQSAQVFKDKTGSLRKLLKKHAELVYINAPHLIPISSNSAPTAQSVEAGTTETTPDGKVEEQRGWYFSTEQLTFNSHDATDFSWGLEESIEVVRKAFEELGPFDGILGFSQGAALGSILCHLLTKGGECQY